ncbi:MAG: acyl-CoA dehydrogenase family protein [Chloroflexi bacterium]|nr:acyl-CoA dehydrogenase family protein [Chloroflexota bacterium]
MDFRFTAEEESFRREVRGFIEREWRPMDRGYDTESIYTASWDREVEEAKQVADAFEKKLVARGWWTMHWPREQGGQEASIGRQLVYTEEMAYGGAPAILGGSFVAPMLMTHGQQWQKREFLPRIASADLDFVQGFTEPNAGSDLASLQTRALRDGDEYVVSGQKTWISYVPRPKQRWGHFLVRTDPSAPKHRGISYLLIDMESPGIVARPLYDGFGRWRHSEIFLDSVRVPARNLIGEENRGWYAAMTTLSFERANSVERPARLRRSMDQFLDFAGSAPGNYVLADPVAKNQLADLRIELEVHRMMAYRVAWLQSRGEVPVKEASISRIWNGGMGQRLFRTFARLLRQHGTLLPGAPEEWTPVGGFIASNSFTCVSNSLGGGSFEIQRNIIAQRALGLPR